MTTTTTAGATTVPAGRRVTPTVWRGPGVYSADELTLEEYHRDIVPGGSLSSSGARKLLDPGCPAQFKWDRDHPQPPKRTFELGTAAHRMVLGDGPDLDPLDFDNYLTKKAQQARDEARAMGVIPLLRHEHQQVKDMATALRGHPQAGPLLAGGGLVEQSLYWPDADTGVMRRCRPDYLKERPDVTLCVDYKSCADASPLAVSKAIYDHGYYMQDPYYLDGIEHILGRPARFVFVFQSKAAPYLITVRELSDADRAIGRAKNAKALRTYARCERTGDWPDWTGDTDQIPYISLPSWAAQREAEEHLS